MEGKYLLAYTKFGLRYNGFRSFYRHFDNLEVMDNFIKFNNIENSCIRYIKMDKWFFLREVYMLEKIDKFINKFLKYDVIIYILLSNFCLIPHTLIANKYGIDGLELIIMCFSFGLSIDFFVKAFKKVFE